MSFISGLPRSATVIAKDQLLFLLYFPFSGYCCGVIILCMKKINRMGIVWAGLFIIVSLCLCQMLISCATGYSPSARTVTELHEAVRDGKEEKVRSLCKKKGLINVQDPEGRTPLHYAASNGQYVMAVNLLDKGASLSITDNKGNTPLHYAVSNGYIDMVSLFLVYGAEKGIENNKGQNPLLIAEKKGFTEIIELLR